MVNHPLAPALQPAAKPALSNENLVINELIREYMEFNGYKHSLSVFMPGARRAAAPASNNNPRRAHRGCFLCRAETGQPVERAFSRPFLAEQLHVAEDETTRRVPLLYSILGEMRNAAPPAAAHHGGAGAEAGVTAYGGADGGGGGAAAATTGDVTGAAAGGACAQPRAPPPRLLLSVPPRALTPVRRDRRASVGVGRHPRERAGAWAGQRRLPGRAGLRRGAAQLFATVRRGVALLIYKYRVPIVKLRQLRKLKLA